MAPAFLPFIPIETKGIGFSSSSAMMRPLNCDCEREGLLKRNENRIIIKAKTLLRDRAIFFNEIDL